MRGKTDYWTERVDKTSGDISGDWGKYHMSAVDGSTCATKFKKTRNARKMLKILILAVLKMKAKRYALKKKEQETTSKMTIEAMLAML